MPPITPNTFGDELYAALGPHAYADAQNDNALFIYCYALAQMFKQVEDLARNNDSGIPWANLGLDTAPDYALPYLAQLVGQDIPVGASSTYARDLIRTPPVQQRGTVAALASEAQKTLTGAKQVAIIERDTSAYHFAVYTLTSQTPDTAATLRALTAVKPAGLIMSYNAVSGYVWDTINPTKTWDATTVTWDQTTNTDI